MEKYLKACYVLRKFLVFNFKYVFIDFAITYLFDYLHVCIRNLK